MSFERPTLAEIIRRVQADAESRIGKKVMRWSLASVMTRVIAGVSHGLHGYIAFVLRQCFTSTAEGNYLERRASEYGIYRLQASKAVGTVTFTGTGVVPAGTQLQNERGAVYVTTDESKDGAAPLEAADAGASGNSEAGMQLTLVSPVVGVMSSAVAGELTGGADGAPILRPFPEDWMPRGTRACGNDFLRDKRTRRKLARKQITSPGRGRFPA